MISDGGRSESMITAKFKGTAAALTLAFCLIVPFVFNNWFLLLPAFIFCIGAYETLVVLTGRSDARLFEDGTAKYSLSWGIFTIFVGLMTLAQVLELIWVLGIIMVWLASVFPFFSMRSRKEAGGRDNLQVLNTIRR